MVGQGILMGMGITSLAQAALALHLILGQATLQLKGIGAHDGMAGPWEVNGKQAKPR